MKITRFQVKGVHGFLDFDLTFDDSLTFLTGINGSGKTTILNLINALLSPGLDYLVFFEYEYLCLSISVGETPIEIEARRNEQNTIVSCSKFPNEKIEIENESVREFIIRNYNRESKSNGIDQQFQKFIYGHLSDNKILKFINELPTPTFMGLESRLFATNLLNDLIQGSRQFIESRKLLNSQLDDGLNVALKLASVEITECYLENHELEVGLRRQLMSILLDFPTNGNVNSVSENNRLISKEERNEARDRLQTVSENISNFSGEMQEELAPLLEFIAKCDEALKCTVGESSKENDSVNHSFQINNISITKIEKIFNCIFEYNEKNNIIFQKVNGFLNSINSFLKPTEKVISYDKSGILKYSQFKVNNKKYIKGHPLGALSSGEKQLVIMFAHLYFNPDTQNANVFLIDEPELSLHVLWEEKFTDAILDAASNTQLIIATHSPTIIMGRLDYCVELTTKNFWSEV